MKRSIFVIVFLVGVLAMPLAARADTPLPGLPVGGQLLSVFPCVNGGLLLIVGPPRPAVVVFQGGISDLYLFYRLTPAPWVAGTYSPGGVCTVGVFPVPVMGTVKKLGTSLLSAFLPF